VVDLRSCASRQTIVLRGARRIVLQFCDETRSHQSIANLVQQEAASESQDLEVILAELTELGFVVSDGKHFLSLAIPLLDYSPSVEVLRVLRDSQPSDYEPVSRNVVATVNSV
jgi:hypothetical protein